MKKDTQRAEASALLERRMAAMEAVLAARRTAVKPPAEPAAARGPGADLRFSVSLQQFIVPLSMMIRGFALHLVQGLILMVLREEFIIEIYNH